MTLLPIVQIPDEILRRKAEPIEKFDPALRQLAQDMVASMVEAKGVGLAAPQIGRSERLFVMRIREDDPRLPEGHPIAGKTLVLVNPVLTPTSEEKEEGPEACLSIPEYGGYVPRWTHISVQARNEWGKPVTYELSGFAARVMQHEIDHLDGVLFLDRLTGEDKLYRLKPREEETNAEAADTIPAEETEAPHP